MGGERETERVDTAAAKWDYYINPGWQMNEYGLHVEW